MDELAQSLLITLKKPSATLDSKLQLFNSLKTNIKHQRIPDSAQSPTLECVRLAIASQTSSALVTVGFSTLSHLIKRLVLQEQAHNVFNSRTQIVPTLLDRLGDGKEAYRSAASQALCDLWPARPMDVEKAIKEGALLSNNVRAKETAMAWITKMHTEQGLQFKSFVPPLVDCLDHADGTVREAAKNNLVDLFRNAPERAKADLKRQLIAHNVRKSIASFILSQLEVGVPAELASGAPAPSHAHREPVEAAIAAPDIVAAPTDPVLPPSADTSNIKPLRVESHRHLEEIFRDMAQHFEGRESETNWMPRDSSILKLRQVLKGNAPVDFLLPLVGSLKHMLENILKVVNSLRTTMSTNGCSLVQEMARTLGPSIDPMVELLMQNAVKICSATKNITAQNGHAMVESILSHVTYNVRLVQHISFASQDKNVQPRTFACSWLKTIIRRQAHSKSGFEHSGGLDLAEKILKKGLADAAPKVRESMRGTFWVFNGVWPARGETILDGLDAKSRQLLEKDPGNPNASNATFTSSVGPTSGAGNVRAVASRTSLKEQIAAQKKANLAAKRMPDRPNSAMATLSPAKPAGAPPTRPVSMVSSGSTRSTPGNSRPTTSGTAAAGQSSLMSGPVRRPKKPEVARPATADPYANMNRRLGRAETPTTLSPGNSPGKSAPSHAKSRSGSGLRPGTSDSDKSNLTNSPRVSPAKSRPRTIHGGDAILRSSPGQSRDLNAGSSPRSLADLRNQRGTAVRENERPRSNHSDLPVMAEEEDNFTLVMPQRGGALDLSTAGIATLEKSRQASPQRTFKTPRKAPTSVTEASAKKVTAESTTEVGPTVYEDPKTAEEEASAQATEEPAKVLEEVVVNEKRQPPEQPREGVEHTAAAQADEKSSPMKNTPAKVESPHDRAEVLKHRRLLSSGVERLRARTLDAHGFRRLQELLKSGAGANDVHMQHQGLLMALTEYVEAPPELLKVTASKAASLKAQALVTIRGLMSLRRDDEEVQQQCGRVMCSLLRARQTTERASALNGELDKTGQEAVRSSGKAALDCIDQVAEFGKTLGAEQGVEQGRTVAAAFGLLGQLLGMGQKKGTAAGEERLGRLGRLAVKYLDNTNADVRRADTEFCMALHASVMAESEGGGDFWGLLQGAQEAQLNLVAYYLARKNAV